MRERDSPVAYADRPKLPEGFEGGTWAKLSHAVAAVQKAQAVGTSFEELYQVHTVTGSRLRTQNHAQA